jgi:hypothetical protein
MGNGIQGNGSGKGAVRFGEDAMRGDEAVEFEEAGCGD